MTTQTPAAPSDTPVATLPADRAGGTHAPRPVTPRPVTPRPLTVLRHGDISAVVYAPPRVERIDGWEFPLPSRWSK